MQKLSLRALLLSSLCALIYTQANAQGNQSFAARPAVQKFIKEFASKSGQDYFALLELFSSIRPDKSVLEKISKPAEKTKTWGEYKKIFDDEARISNGMKFYQDNIDALKRAQEEFGVPAEIITAILGVETRYGTVTGTTPVFAALATLCFDYEPRAKFFCSELESFLTLQKKQGWSAWGIKGSYAGAMGMPQFMPSSYLNDAINYDGEKNINLWKSPTDVVGSVGNYLKNRGWVKDGFWALRLSVLPEDREKFAKSHQPNFTIGEILQDKGLAKLSRAERAWMEKHKDEKVGGIFFQDENEEIFILTGQNFYVITHYNSSPMYAYAVLNLAKDIREQVDVLNKARQAEVEREKAQEKQQAMEAAKEQQARRRRAPNS